VISIIIFPVQQNLQNEAHLLQEEQS